MESQQLCSQKLEYTRLTPSILLDLEDSFFVDDQSDKEQLIALSELLDRIRQYPRSSATSQELDQAVEYSGCFILPTEVWHLIFEYLNPRELCNYQLACQHTHHLVMGYSKQWQCYWFGSMLHPSWSESKLRPWLICLCFKPAQLDRLVELYTKKQLNPAYPLWFSYASQNFSPAKRCYGARCTLNLHLPRFPNGLLHHLRFNGELLTHVLDHLHKDPYHTEESRQAIAFQIGLFGVTTITYARATTWIAAHPVTASKHTQSLVKQLKSGLQHNSEISKLRIL